MATIEKLICNLKEEVSKWFYQKGEVDEKVNSKADNSLVTGSSNGLMSSSDKIKLDGVATGANKTVVDSAMSSTSVNPVQNKVVKAELDSLNTTKANTNHTHTTLIKSADIPPNADLNDYKTVGFYICGQSNSLTLLNKPLSFTGGGCRLEVLSSGNGVTQMLRTYGANTSLIKIYFRHFFESDDVWLDWQQVITTNNVDTALSSTSTNPVQNKVVNAQLTSLNNNKANSNHTHGVAKQTSTIASNTFLTQLGNLAIFSWWTGYINISSANTWTDIWTLPVTNKGKTVWSVNIYNGVDRCYFRINENSNKVQALSNKTGNIPLQPGELLFFIE